MHKEFDGQRLSKYVRLPFRVAVSVILICLGLAESLTSLGLVSTTTGLVVFVLMVDLYGGTSKHDTFWKCRGQCRYSTECALKKKILVNALKNGETVNLEDMQEARQGKEKGTFEVTLSNSDDSSHISSPFFHFWECSNAAFH